MNSTNLLKLLILINRKPKTYLFRNNVNFFGGQNQQRNYSDNLPPDKWITKKIYHAISIRVSSKLKIFDDMCKDLNTKASVQLSNYNNAVKKVYTSDKVMNNKYFRMVFKALCVCRSTIKTITDSELFKAFVCWCQVKLFQLLKISIDFGNKIHIKYEKGELGGGCKSNKSAIKTDPEPSEKIKTSPEKNPEPSEKIKKSPEMNLVPHENVKKLPEKNPEPSEKIKKSPEKNLVPHENVKKLTGKDLDPSENAKKST